MKNSMHATRTKQKLMIKSILKIVRKDWATCKNRMMVRIKTKTLKRRK